MTHPLTPYGWSDRVAALYEADAMEDGRAGRVTRVDRIGCAVETAEGEVRATAADLPAVGDWVSVSPNDLGWEVRRVLPRWSALTRHRAGEATGEQVLAANVDVILVVAALDRELHLGRFERELVVAWESGARPVIVLTKADLVADPAPAVEAVTARAGGAEVLVTSSTSGLGMEALTAALRPDRTAVLFGSSGAGKSTLVNRLVDSDVVETGAVRDTDHKGRHTTTARYLIPLPGGGVLLDTPGVRAVGLWTGDEGLPLAFPDIEELATSCRFSDCTHEHEPGCAVREAVDAGTLDTQRASSYLKLRNELDQVAQAREDQARAAEKLHEARAHARASRRNPKRR